jgi:hypothetical protein
MAGFCKAAMKISIPELQRFTKLELTPHVYKKGPSNCSYFIREPTQ